MRKIQFHLFQPSIQYSADKDIARLSIDWGSDRLLFTDKIIVTPSNSPTVLDETTYSTYCSISIHLALWSVHVHRMFFLYLAASIKNNSSCWRPIRCCIIDAPTQVTERTLMFCVSFSLLIIPSKHILSQSIIRILIRMSLMQTSSFSSDVIVRKNNGSV